MVKSQHVDVELPMSGMEGVVLKETSVPSCSVETQSSGNWGIFFKTRSMEPLAIFPYKTGLG